MPDVQTTAAIVFLILLSLFVYWKRHKLEKHGAFPFFYIMMYKTSLGLPSMDSWAKRHRKLMLFLGYAGVVIGFLGMIAICIIMIDVTLKLFTRPEAAPGVGLVLPFKVKGVFFVPFFYWIISIFIIAIVHEFAHGVIARVHNIKVKSSGFAFLGIFLPLIPAAFVEPDEKVMRKRPHRQQLSVFAAGAFANILLAIITLGLLLSMAPVIKNIVELDGVEVTGFVEGTSYPAQKAGIVAGEIVREIEGKKIESLSNFTSALKGKKPGDVLLMKTDKNKYEIPLAENPDNASIAYLGVFVQQHTEYKKSFTNRFGTMTPSVIVWIAGLLNWLIILNLGIGLFNLLPIPLTDGGRMLQLVAHKFLGELRGNKIWYYTCMFFLILLIANIAFAFIR